MPMLAENCAIETAGAWLLDTPGMRQYLNIKKDHTEGNVDNEYESLLLEGLMTRFIHQHGEASLRRSS